MKIIYQDEDILVLDKPSGITVNRSDTTANESTVQDIVEEIFPIDKEFSDTDFYKRSGIVHRIDKETSGILLVAKKLQAFERLQKQFKDREIEKSYIALVHGRMIPAEGEISSPVGRLPWNRKRFGVLAGGREAVTLYKTLWVRIFKAGRDQEALSLIEAKPKTGRTHQIRVHLKSSNNPIFSDNIYAGRKISRGDRRFLPRLFLHARKIKFRHPTSDEFVEFESELPQDLKRFTDSLEEE